MTAGCLMLRRITRPDIGYLMHCRIASIYDDVKVPKARLVGEENKGFYYMMEALGSERNTVFVPTRLSPILNSMLQYVQEFSDKRLKLSINPQIREKLAQIAIEIEVAQVLAERSRWIESSGGALTHQPEVTKIMVSELQQRTC